MARRSIESSGNPVLVVGAALGLCVVGFAGVVTQAVREQASADAAAPAAPAVPSATAAVSRGTAPPGGLATAPPLPRGTVLPGARASRTAPRNPAAGRTPASGRAPFYSTCAQVRAAGKAPLRGTDPGFRARLDTDGDGVACEANQGAGRTAPPR